MVLEIKELKASNGKPYVALKLADKTGQISAKKWDTESIPAKDGDICSVDFLVGEYKGKVDGTISSIFVAQPPYDMSDFVKASAYDSDFMWSKLALYLKGFESPHFKTVAEALFDETSRELFKKSPAATMMHHAFVHGLLEHTLEMLNCADVLLMQPFFENTLNRDLCMFGIMFHDFGKIYEYSSEPGFKVKPQGLLVGHIPMVAARIYEEAGKIRVPDVIRDHMMHVVLAHHGIKAWGSPNLPACPEAVFVHHVDNLHGSVFGLIQAREAATTETFKYGFGDQQLHALKKSFDELVKEDETNGF